MYYTDLDVNINDDDDDDDDLLKLAKMIIRNVNQCVNQKKSSIGNTSYAGNARYDYISSCKQQISTANTFYLIKLKTIKRKLNLGTITCN